MAKSDLAREDLSLDPPASRAETAAYIADLSAHLATLARRQGFDALAYLLDMARLEAEGVRSRPSQ